MSSSATGVPDPDEESKTNFEIALDNRAKGLAKDLVKNRAKDRAKDRELNRLWKQVKIALALNRTRDFRRLDNKHPSIVDFLQLEMPRR
jgi:hypothetical protein